MKTITKIKTYIVKLYRRNQKTYKIALYQIFDKLIVKEELYNSHFKMHTKICITKFRILKIHKSNCTLDTCVYTLISSGFLINFSGRRLFNQI